VDLEALPGADLIETGLAALARGRESVPARLVAVGGPQLRRLGLQVPQLHDPRLEPLPDYSQRAGLLRAKLLTRKHRARLADALIAQSCIDHGVRLVTRDADFRPGVYPTP
jgi:hypothetical protein